MSDFNEKLFHLREGALPLVVSIPHAGTYLPDDIRARLTPVGQAVVDTDWHVDKLYCFLEEQDVTVLTATHSRTVVDLNRSPQGGKLYPGRTETGICPTESFAGERLYEGEAPDAEEIARRVAAYWQPYHDTLAAQIARLRDKHGWVRVLDGHSIRAEVPRLFEGALPDLNFGTNDGAACEASLVARVVESAGDAFSTVLNGRFKGGFITRHYGIPSAGVQVVQLEMAQRIYMDEAAPRVFEGGRAAGLVDVLRRVVGAMIAAAGS